MLANTKESYGAVARGFHWLTALLILTNIGLGLYAENLPRGTDAEVARVVSLFSLHKTIGVAAFFVALLRILWALRQPRPGLIHGERRAEALLAETVHWALYGAMVIMPLSGWILHAATDGYSRILWPLSQSLPMVPKSAALAHAAEAVHKLSAWVLYVTIGLHLLGVIKHVVIDRDETLARMSHGRKTAVSSAAHSKLAPLAAFVIWVVILIAAIAGARGAAPPPAAPPQPAATAEAGNWVVSKGTLGIALKQMGSTVTGSFTGWTATIAYDEKSRTGHVTVKIPVTGLTLGSVTEQALGPDFFNAEAHPTATFDADIAPAQDGDGLIAAGQMEIAGASAPVSLPFTLNIDGDTAHMTGETTLDRRDYGMGANYPNEDTVGFSVTVSVDLTAKRS